MSTTAVAAALTAADAEAETSTADKICAFLEALPGKFDTVMTGPEGKRIFYTTNFEPLIRTIRACAAMRTP